MQPQTLDRRVERLEQRVAILEQLPARVDALTLQVSQLREEMHAEFSAVRTEIREGDEAVIRTLREEMRIVVDTINAGNQEVMAQARTLYEDMRTRMALIQEGRASQGKDPSIE